MTVAIYPILEKLEENLVHVIIEYWTDWEVFVLGRLPSGTRDVAPLTSHGKTTNSLLFPTFI